MADARNDAAACAALIARLVGEGETRRLVARVLGTDASLAGAAGESRWSVTLASRTVRMNVGAIFTVDVRDRALRIVVESALLDSATRARLDSLGASMREDEFASQPGTGWVEVPATVLAQVWPLVEEAHGAAVRRAARWKTR